MAKADDPSIQIKQKIKKIKKLSDNEGVNPQESLFHPD